MKMDVQQANAQWSRLVDAALTADEVIIAKAGKPCAKLVPIDATGARAPGAFRGVIGGDPLGPVGADDSAWG